MEKKRCSWAEGVEDVYVTYHDEEWGVPVYDDRKFFEMLILEGFQAGLSWLTILKRRDNFRRAFDNFDVEKVAQYQADKLEALRQDEGIIRNRLKIKGAVRNAQVFIEIQKEYGSFSNYLWGYTNQEVVYIKDGEMVVTSPLSDAISKDLKKRGMTFVGSVIIYSFLQATGVVNDHVKECYLHQK